MRALLVCLAAALVLVAEASAAPLIRVVADPSEPGERLPRSFLGISQEYDQIERFTGGPAGGYNTATGALMRRLGAYGGGRPVLRIGGNTADSTWWATTNGPRPPGIGHTASPRMLLGMSMFAQATRSRLLPTLNLANPDRSILMTQAREFARGLPRRLLYAFELGNEPDFYPRRPLFRKPDGSRRYTRPRSYNPGAYTREVRRLLPRVRRAIGSRRIAGPSTSLSQDWVRALPRVLRDDRGFDLATLHAYPLNGCDEGGPATAGQLVSLVFLRRLLLALEDGVELARRQGRAVRVTEGNSVSCGGQTGVSDAGAASLWMVDYLFGIWLVGAEGVNIHAASPLYRPFGFAGYDERWLATVNAPYYGMLMFAEATAERARLLPRVTFSARPRDRRNVRAWGTLDKRRRIVRVVVLNEEPLVSGPAVVRVLGARSRARLTRLTTDGLDATTGIEWGGQHYTTPTAGRPVGRVARKTVRRRKGQRFAFRLPRASAAMLTVKVRRPRKP